MAKTKKMTTEGVPAGPGRGKIMSGMKGKSGWIVLAVLTVIPFVLWAFAKPIPARFDSFPSVLTSVGQVLALLGMSIFSLNLVLSARLKFLEKFFNGMDRVYASHHVIGGIAFVLLMFHPLVLAARYIPSSTRLAALFLIPGGGLSNNLGIIALYSMMALLLITFYVRSRMRYQRWKITHKFLFAAFIFGFLHMFLVASDVSVNIPMRTYMFTLAGAGIAAASYRTLLGPVTVGKLDYTVDDVNPLGAGVTQVTLKPKGKKISFTAGQFLFVSIRDPALPSEWHPFTISSAPSEENVRLSIKALGDYTAKLKDAKKGGAAKIEGPFGMFSYGNYESKGQVWIAGGIGITPFLSMARSMLDGKGGDYKIDLYYCVKNDGEAIFQKELQEIALKHKNLKVIVSRSDTDGYMNAGIIEKESNAAKEKKKVFICGPPPMMNSLKKQFIALGVPKRSIVTEEFGL